MACVATVAFWGGCARQGVAEAPKQHVEGPHEDDTDGEQELRESLLEPELSVIATTEPERAERWFRTVERLGREERRDSIDTLFGVLLASHGVLRLQRAALFSLVRRAPASLEVARELLEHEVPELSRLVRLEPRVTKAEQRSYERGLAAAALGISGLVEARAPLREALAHAQEDSERVLFVLALARLQRHGEGYDFLREAFAKTPEDAQVSDQLSWGLLHLAPFADLLPCSFEVARIGSPVLAAELLAEAGQALGDDELAPALLERADRVWASNQDASRSLLRSAAQLASQAQFASVREVVQRRAPVVQDDYAVDAVRARALNEWVDGLAPAFSRCGEDLACHWKVLDAPNVDLWQFKSASFVAAHAAPDQAPAMLAQMERMSRPYWLADALDQRLSSPSPEQLARVRRLGRRGPEGAQLYAAPRGDCARFDSPLEELAIRLEARANAMQKRDGGMAFGN